MVVQMTESDLDDLIYYTSLRATKRALDRHFNGLLPFLTKMNDDLELIIKEQEYIKTFLKMQLEQKKDGTHD